MDAVKRTGKPFIAAVSGVKNSGKTTFMAVSYTHLDVYKRQQVIRANQEYLQNH